jgi:hypothetical protein
MRIRWNGGAKCATFSIHLLCSIVKGFVQCMTLPTSFIFLVFFYCALDFSAPSRLVCHYGNFNLNNGYSALA